MKSYFKFIGSIFTLTILLLSIGCKKDKPEIQGQSTAIFNMLLSYGTINDIDGNVYKTIIIGSQTWMAENLSVKHYNNGDIITQGLVITDSYSAIREGAYGSYNDTNDKDTIATFGLLYNWDAISDNRCICPEGWHIPSQNEWEVIFSTLGSGKEAELKLIESGSTHWYFGNLGNNSSGFTALPSGEFMRGNFYGIGYWTGWWTSTEIDEIFVLGQEFSANLPAQISSFPKNLGFSVRCIKD